MKNLLFIAAILFMSISFTSCEAESLENEQPTEQLIDPDKACPPNDRNCNGIPDDEE